MTEMHRVLVAVVDSPASLAAARAAVDLAARLHGELRAVHVLVDGDVSTLLGKVSGQGRMTERRGSAAVAVLRHVADLAGRAGVPVTTVQAEGDVAARILDEVRDWPADLVVLGRTTRRGAGDPYIGIETQRVLEFCDRPVLVVPG
jgi:nucleotide-binding universal stress UspA family protein